MKAKSRLLWMKLHAYFACFFLPITLLYITTGLLYFFDVKGDVTKEFEYKVSLSQGWPTNADTAKEIVLAKLANKNHIEIPADYYLYKGIHYWYGRKQEVNLTPTDDNNMARLIVKEHDFLEQLLIIHKGYAGSLFKVFSILFGFSLAFSIISGVVITLQLPQLKKQSMLAIFMGTSVLAVLFI